MKMRKSGLYSSLTAAVMLVTLTAAQGASITWTNLLGGNWNATNNWSPHQVPGAADTAVITNVGTYTVTLNVSATLTGLVLGASTGVQTQTLAVAGQTLTLNGQATVGSLGLFNVTNGVLAGGMTLAGTMNVAGGLLTNSGSLTLAASGVLNLTANTFSLSGPLTNNGTVNWQGAAVEIENNNTANFLGAIWNQPGGRWNVSGNQTLTNDFGLGYEIFHNAGTLTKTNGTSSSIINVFMDNNNGSVLGQSGSLQFWKGCNMQGNYQATNGAILFVGGNFFWSGPTTNFSGNIQFSGGSVTLTNATTNLVASSATISNLFQLTGTATLTNCIIHAAETLSATVNWVGGVLTNNASLTVAGSGQLNLVGGSFAVAGPLTNNGTVNWQGATLQVLNNNTISYRGGIWNQPGAQWNVLGNQALTNNFATGYEIFHNAGVLTKTNSAGTSTLYVYLDDIGGTVQVQSGTLQLVGGSNLGGSLQAASGTTIICSAGSFTYGGAANLIGNVQFTGGNLTLTGSITNLAATGMTISNLVNVTSTAWLTNCTIRDAETVLGTVYLAGGTVTNNGSLTVGNASVLNLTGNSIFHLAGPLTNNGTVNWLAGQVMVQNNNTTNDTGVIWNQLGAQWTVLTNQAVTNYFRSGYEIFHNAGQLLQTNVAGAATFYVYLDNNSGTVQAKSGTLQFAGGSNLGGAVQAAAGTLVTFSGGTFFWSGPTTNFLGNIQFTGGSVTLTNATTNLVATSVTISNLLNLTGTAWLTNCIIQDAETLAATAYWAGGILTNSGSLTVASNGVLNLPGGTFAVAGPLTNNGIVNWQGATLQEQNNNTTNYLGGIWNQAGAQWNILGNQTSTTNFGGGYEIFHNAGVLTKTNSAGTSTLYVYLDNTGGSVQVQSGTLQLAGGSNLGGSLQVAAGAAINCSGGGFTYGGTANITGNIQFTGGNLALSGSITNLAITGMTVSNLWSLTGVAWLTNCTIRDPEIIIGTVYWSGGTVTNNGSLTVSNASVLNLTGNNTFHLAGALTNNGTVNWLAGPVMLQTNVPVNNVGAIWNQPGAQWIMLTNQTLSVDSSSAEIFHNAGLLLLQTNVSGVVTFNVYLDNNGGTVQVQSGTMQFAGGSNLGGSIQAAAGTLVTLSGGAFFWSGPTANFVGNIQFTGGSVTLTNTTTNLAATSVTVSNLSFLTGTSAWFTNCTIADPETLSATVIWSGGTLSRTGSLTVAGNGSLNLLGLTIIGPLTNNGTVNWLGGTLRVENNNTTNYLGGIWNLAGAQWVIQVNQTLQTDFGAGTEVFHNAGWLIQTNASGTTTFNVYLDNNGGTVQVHSGTLKLAGGSNLGGNLQADSGTLINCTGGNFSYGGSANFSGNVQITGGTVNVIGSAPLLAAAGVTLSNLVNVTGTAWLTNCSIKDAESIAATVYWSGGTIANSGSLTVSNSGVLNLVANTLLIAGPLTNNGTVNSLGADMYVENDHTTNYLGGIWNQPTGQWNIQVCLDYQYMYDNLNTGYAILHNAGMLTQSISTSTGYIQVYLDNTGGTVQAQSGSLLIEGGGKLGGSFSASTGASIFFSYGNLVCQVTPLFSGNVQIISGTVTITGPITNLVASGVIVSNLVNIVGTAWFTNSLIPDAERIVGTVNYVGGTLTNIGSLTVGLGGVLNLCDYQYYNQGVYVDNGLSINAPLTNNGTVNWLGGSLQLANDGTSTNRGVIWNQTGAQWNILCDQFMQASWTNGIFHNAGALTKTNSTGITQIGPYFDNNGGTVTAASGRIYFVGGCNLGGGFLAAPGAAIDFTSGSFSWSGQPTNFVGNVQITGGAIMLTPGVTNLVFSSVQIFNLTNLTGVAWLTNCYVADAEQIVGTVNWSGGYIRGGGSLTVSGAGVLNLLGPNGLTIDGPLTNNATVNWIGGYLEMYNDNSTYFGGIWNQPGAQWNIQCSQTLEGYYDVYYGTGGEIFHNAGALNQSDSTLSTTLTVYLDNTGGAVTAAGTLRFGVGSNLGGSFTATTIGAINFTGGNYFLSAVPPNFTGNVHITGGSETLTGDMASLVASGVVISNLFHVTGTAWLTNCIIDGAERIAGTVNWIGGTIYYGGGSLIVATNGILNVVNGCTIDGPLTNNGTVNWTGGSIYVAGGFFNYTGSIWNQPGAQWNIQGSQSLGNNGSVVFYNAGTLTQSGAGSSTSFGIYLDNTGGTVQALAGTMQLGQGCNLAGSFQAAAGAAIDFSNGTIPWSGTPNFNGNVQITGGTVLIVGSTPYLTASGANVSNLVAVTGTAWLTNCTVYYPERITNTVYWSGGGIGYNSASLTVAASGILNLVGAFGVVGPLTNNGTVNWLGGTLGISSGSTVWNQPAGQWNIQGSQTLGGLFNQGVFQNAGTLTQTGVGSVTTVNAYLNNTGGTIQIQSGTISLLPGEYSLTNGSVNCWLNATNNFGALKFPGSGVTQGVAVLAGTLGATLGAGYLPQVGDTFPLLTYGKSASGAFTGFNLPALATWQTSYGTTNFTIAVTGVSLTQSIVTWTSPAPITYGSPLTTNQLNATANVPGNFVYTPALTQVLSAGSNTLSVTFTPSDTNYNTMVASVRQVVTPAPLTIAISNASRSYGQTNPVFVGTLAGVTNSDTITASYACGAAAISPPGNYAIVPVLTDPGHRLGNYAIATNGGTLTVLAGPAPTLTGINPASGTTNGGVAVSLTGRGFELGAGVTMGGHAATSVVVNSGTQLSAVTPSGLVGSVNVVMSNPDGTSATLTNGFTYTGAAPIIITSPTNLLAVQGGPAAFQVTAAYATGYQWMFNGVNLTNNAQISGVFSNVLTLTAVQAANVGNYRVLATNAFGTALSASASLSLLYTNPPLISGVVVTPSTFGAVITWQTDVPAYDQVSYGLGTNYTVTNAKSTYLATSHSVTLSGLTPVSLYHFTVVSVDAAPSQSGDLTFTTLPDSVPPTVNLTYVPSTLCGLPYNFTWSGSDNWTPATNLVYAYQIDSQGWSAFGAATNLVVSQLADGSHQFEVEAQDAAGNVSYADGWNFYLETTAPVITGIATTPFDNSCVVTWQTVQPTSFSVSYGTNSAYGQTNSASYTASSHSVTMSGLSAATTYHFRITATDACSLQTVSTDQQFTTPAAPILEVVNVVAPAAVWTGSGFAVAWVDTNAGPGAATGTWQDAVYLSLTNRLNTNSDLLLGKFTFNSTINPGQSVGRSQLVTISQTNYAYRYYYISVLADAGNAIYQIVPKTNNVGVSATNLYVNQTLLPALTVSAVDAPANALGGQPVTVSWTVCNQGAGATDASLWYDHLYLSTTTNLSGEIADYGEFSNPYYLESGECYDQAATVTLPVGLGGNCYFIVRTDDRNFVSQSTTAGNTGVAMPLNLQLVNAGFLHVVSAQVAPAPPTATWGGQTVTCTYIVQNAGQSTIFGPWDDRVTLSPVANYINGTTTGFVYENDLGLSGPLAPGASYTNSAQFILPVSVSGTNIFGTWYVVPVVDIHFVASGAGIVVGGIGRDELSAPLDVNLPPPADLVTTSVIAPTNAVTGQTITISWTVANNGVYQTDVGSWNDAVYAFTNPVFNLAQSIPLGVYPHYGILNLNASYTNHVTVAAPTNFLAAGALSVTNYLFVVADNGNGVIEITKTNNMLGAVQPLVVQLPAPPPPPAPAALAVTKVTAPNTTVAGTSATITWTVANQGAGATSTNVWTDSVYLSPGPLLNNATEIHLADVVHSGALAAGASYHQSQNLGLPACISGTYYVVVVVDSGNVVNGDGAETNQTLATTNSLVVWPTTAARLTVSTASAPASVQAGQPLTVAWTVQNLGNATTTAPWDDIVYLSPTPGFVRANSLLLGVYPHATNLSANASYQVSQSPQIPLCDSGPYYVVVVTDLGQVVNSLACYTNNVAVATNPVSIYPGTFASLQVAGLSAPTNVNAGSPWTVKWGVTNAGLAAAAGPWRDAVYASLSATLDTNALLLGQFVYTNGLMAGGSYQQTQMVAFPGCLSGSFNVFVVADISNVVNGASCLMNAQAVSMNPVVVNYGVYPDLVVTAISNAATGAAGQPFTVSWSVTNLGLGTAAGPWVDSVYLTSRAPFNTNNSILLGNYPQSAGVPASGGYTQSTSFTAPVVSGTYYLVVVIDSGRSVSECPSTGLNAAFSPTTVTVPVALYPDLQVTSVSAPASASAGQYVSVSWVVTNEGTETTPTRYWTDAVYLSLNQGLGAQAVRLGAANSPSGLAVGQSYTNSVNVVIPSGLSGPYYLLVLADSGASMFEYLGYNDSLGWTENPLLINLPAPSDLAATGVTLSPATGVPGASATITWSVVNSSSNTIPATWSDEIYLSTNQVWDLSAVPVATATHSGLAPYAGYTNSWTGPLPALTPGTYYAIVRTDTRDTVNELTLTNNTAASAATINLDVPVLPLGQLVTNQLSTGAAVYYKFSAPAGVTVKITVAGSASSVNELFVRYASMPDLGRYDFLYNNPQSSNQQIVIPAAQAGYYYLMLHGASEPGGPLPCVLEAVLVPLAINSVSATHIGDNGQVTLTLNGAKFQAGATVQLVSDTNVYNAATNIWSDPTMLTARFLFTNAVDGTYDVVLTNPDNSSAKLLQAITIETALPLSAQIVQGVVNQLPRQGLPFYWNGSAVNAGNVDIPYLTIAVQASPGYPFRLTPPPGALLTDSNSMDNGGNICSFVVRNVAVGQVDSFAFMIPVLPACGYYVIIPSVQRKTDYLAWLLTQGESLREYLSATNAGDLPASIAAAVTDAHAFAQVFAQQFVSPGLLDASDLTSLPMRATNSPLYLSGPPSGGGAGCSAACLLAHQTGYWLASGQWAACIGSSQSPGVSSQACFLDFKMQVTAADAANAICANFSCLPANSGGTIVGSIQDPCSWRGFGNTHSSFPIDSSNPNFFDPNPSNPNSSDPNSSDPNPFDDGDFAVGTDDQAKPGDPNELLGLAGYGAAAFLGVQAPWPYTIYFENESNATAFASQIAITNVLDPSLDIRSFRISQIAFGDVSILVPTNRTFFQVRVPAPAPNPTNVVVDVTVGVDVANNDIFCTLYAIDLNTGQLVTSAQEGVLPPNTTNNIGQGYLVYSILPKGGVATGTVVTNQASIVFNNNDPIATNPTTNTVDALPPVSMVAALPSAQVATNFVVSWSGADDLGGSGVAGYDVYYRVNAGPWQAFLTGVTYTNTTFAAQPGNTYAFYSRAQDNVGNVEMASTTAEAVTFISTNTAPILGLVSNQLAKVGIPAVIPVTASNLSGTPLTYSLVNGPAGASINPSTGIISWTPTPGQAGTTNLLTVQVANAGPPPLSDSQSFLAVVADYASLTLGSGMVQAGGNACLPLTLVSSAPLTNINFTLTYSSNRLAGLSVTPDLSQITRCTVTPVNATYVAVTLQTAPGTWLVGTEQVATVCFTAPTDQLSSLAPVQVSLFNATETSGQNPATLASASATVAVLAGHPFLTLAPAGPLLVITLYGNPGSAYILQASPSLLGPWTPVSGMILTNYLQSVIENELTSGAMFYRAVSPNLPFAFATPAGVGQENVTLFGTPGLPYFVESGISSGGPWTPINALILTNSSQSFIWSNTIPGLVLQAVSAATPLLSARLGAVGQLQLTFYGLSGTHYILQSGPALTGPWTMFNTFVLTNASQSMNINHLTNSAMFFRLMQP